MIYDKCEIPADLQRYFVRAEIGLEQTPAAYVAEIVGVMRACRRALKPGGTLWLNLGDSYAATTKGSGGGWAADPKNYASKAQAFGARKFGIGDAKPKDLLMIPAQVALALRADGWWLRSEIIWHKSNAMPESVRDRPTKAHEQVFLLSNAERYWYDKDAIAEGALQPIGQPSFVAQHKQAALGANQTGTLGTNQGNPFRNARTVWTIATEPCDLAHFALMPTELARRCILAGCPKGGVVLDPFGGGGTTGLTAARHGRRAILCELNPEYAEIARDRIAREWREKPIKTAADAGPLFEGSV